MASQLPVKVVFVSLLEAAVSFHLFPNVFSARSFTGAFVVYSVINWSIYALYIVVIYPFFLSPLRHLPKPSGSWGPIIAHGPIMFSRPPGEAHLKMMKDCPDAGLIHFRSFFHVDRLLLASPAAIADVLVHKTYDFEKTPWIRAFLKQFLGDGLLTTEGEEHKHQRKHIMPAFSFRHIKELYPVFWSKSLELCDVVKAEMAEKMNDVLELNHFATQVTMDIIGLAGLGRDIGSLRNSEDELISTYEEILEPTSEKGIYFVMHLLFPPRFIKMLPWKLNERTRITTGSLKRICTEFVQEKKARMKTESEEQIDILSILLRSNTFSDQGMVDQLLTFLAAGHETTSSAFTWASHLLAINPSVQTRLRAEIHEAISSPKWILTDKVDLAALLESLPYLNAVCNETLRLFPTIPVSARIAVRNTTISSQHVPAGTLCFIVPWAINRNPALWGPDAGEFRPERWIDQETGRANGIGSAESNYAFLTFLHGPRSCIGERFARAELRALLAVFCGSFEMSMADPKEVVRAGGTITSKPINGMKLRLKPVDW
ncbi:cytochrome P450 [Clohesyomyces aquaticus]|uniref:Cytochrome P450 n=1 Tax=Clohesyomyces aquaticus TaxID=1231657 RepID=A0A1Y1ZCE1_9PLEO|nr:cytochrome P450 [Clohesyomyces aquaticus]